MNHRQTLVVPALVALALLVGSCADLITVLAGQPAQPDRPVPAVQPTVVPTTAAQGGSWVTVDTVSATDSGIRIAGSVPLQVTGTSGASGGGVNLLAVFVDWCVLDQVGNGVCAAGGRHGADMHSLQSNIQTFEHVVPPPSGRLQDFLLLRPVTAERPEPQALGSWLRLAWLGAGEVDVRAVGRRANMVAVDLSGDGTTAVASGLPAQECYDTSTHAWGRCFQRPNETTVLFIRLGGRQATRLLEMMPEAVGPDSFYGRLFPQAPEACIWRTSRVRAYDDDVTEGLEAPLPDDPAAAREAASYLYAMWWNVGVQAQQQPAAALEACGWVLTEERKQAVAGRLLELATRSGAEASAGDLEEWTEMACEAGSTVCDQFVALRDERRRAEDEQRRRQEEQRQARDQFFARADALQGVCDECAEAVAYDNRQLSRDCDDNMIYEACRRLNRIVQNRCSDKCAPARRCNECIRQFAELVGEVSSAEVEQQAMDNCTRQCR
ncbi:MAG: hypothetical protein JXB32_14860 [Deltaproteobacteria bacterium]|nr:hypothetical protein [Deltaproteobacteria bacterium]